MDFKKLAKIIKNSDLTEEALFSLLSKQNDEQMIRHLENRDTLNISEFRKERKELKKISTSYLKEFEDYGDELFKQYVNELTRMETIFKRQSRIIIQQERLALEMVRLQQQIQNPVAVDDEPLIMRRGRNKSNKLSYINIMTQRNFSYADDPKAPPPHAETDIKRLLLQAHAEAVKAKLGSDVRFFVNFDTPNGHLTYQSGITANELLNVANRFNMDTDSFLEEYHVGSTVYGVSLNYK